MHSTLAIPGGERWQREFGFLGETKMEATFLLLLTMARSKNGLRKLHSLLPTNCRLLRDDLLCLEKFWQDMFEVPPGGHQLDRDRARALLLLTCPSNGLADYYALNLTEGRTEFPSCRYRPINSWLNPELPSRIAYGGTGDFRARLFDTECHLWCGLPCERPDHVIVGLALEQSILTESFAHHAMQLPPFRTAPLPNDGYVRFVYPLPAGALSSHVCSWQKQTGEFLPFAPNVPGVVLARDTFPAALQELLAKQNIPVTQIQAAPAPDWLVESYRKQGLAMVSLL